MVATSARRAVLPALLAIAALLALPNAAGAALTWGPCVDFRGVKCASLTVPLDRAGVDPGSIDLRIGRAGGTCPAPRSCTCRAAPAGGRPERDAERGQLRCPSSRIASG